MVAFWGCDVTETKAAVVDVPQKFVLNLCNATCGASSAESHVVLGLETQQVDGKIWKGAVAHLGDNQPLQVKLDLVFGHRVKFYLAKGSGVVNLTGYFQLGPPADLLEEEIEKTSNVVATPAKNSKKRARDEKKTREMSWDEISSASTDSEKVSDKETTAAIPAPSVKEKQEPAEADAVTSQNPAASLQKKKRKKKHKKQIANGDAK